MARVPIPAKSDAARLKLLPTLAQGAALCQHLDPHVILPVDGVEAEFRAWVDERGWFQGGYCPAYYPLWLRSAFRRAVDRTLPVVAGEPLIFSDEARWLQTRWPEGAEL